MNEWDWTTVAVGAGVCGLVLGLLTVDGGWADWTPAAVGGLGLAYVTGGSAVLVALWRQRPSTRIALAGAAVCVLALVATATPRLSATGDALASTGYAVADSGYTLAGVGFASALGGVALAAPLGLAATERDQWLAVGLIGLATTPLAASVVVGLRATPADAWPVLPALAAAALATLLVVAVPLYLLGRSARRSITDASPSTVPPRVAALVGLAPVVVGLAGTAVVAPDSVRSLRLLIVLAVVALFVHVAFGLQRDLS